MKKKKTRQIKKYNVFILVLLVVLLILIFLNSFLILKYGILPYKYLIVYFALITIIPGVFFFFLIKKKFNKIVKIVFSVLMILFQILLGFLFYYLSTTFNFIDSTFVNHNYITKNYYVLAPKDSSYEKLDDVDERKIGYVEVLNMNYKKAVEHLQSKIKIEAKDYLDLKMMFEAIDLTEIDVILMADDYYEIVNEDDETFSGKYKIIYEFSIKEDANDFTKDIDVTKDPFIVLISGIDKKGEITAISRSDVNIVVVVNPNTHQILMVHIPRDYYIKFHGQEARDKLTHSGLYGTEMTVKTVEDLLNIDINYYFKVNFTSVVDIVDAIGGVDVYSDYSFVSAGGGYWFEKGFNRVDGTKALAFVRTRKVLKGGDRARGKNQQALIQAVLNKAMSPAIITSYSSLLAAVNGKFATNLSSEKMLDLIKMQLDKMPKWNFTSLSLDGSDSDNYTSVFPTTKKYVMEPDQKTIDAAIEAIGEVLNGKVLDSSYHDNTSGWVNTPEVYVPPKEEPKEPTEEEEENPDGEDGNQEELNPNNPESPDDSENNETPENPNNPPSDETKPDSGNSGGTGSDGSSPSGSEDDKANPGTTTPTTPDTSITPNSDSNT